MNSLFGDATSAMPTPQTLAEAESLFSGHRSPVPSMDLNRRALDPDNAIPGLDIDPIDQGKDVRAPASSDGREGLGGWISNLVKKNKGNGEGDSQSGRYSRVDQDEE